MFLLFETIGILIGALLLTIIKSYIYYKSLKIGLSSYGGLIGGFIFIIIYSVIFKKRLKVILYLLMPSIPLMYGIGKIGCFLVGCCHGIVYNGLFSVKYSYSNVLEHNMSFFPIQILEAIVFITIFIYYFILNYKGKFNNKILGKEIIICGSSKFLLDFLRFKETGAILSFNQIISLVFIFVGTIMIYLEHKEQVKKYKIIENFNRR